MRTAEEIYLDNGCESKKDVIQAMKEYAHEVAKLALIDCVNGLQIDLDSNEDLYCTCKISLDKESILNTEIKLP